MRLLVVIPFLLLCGCVFNVTTPLDDYDSQIMIADMTLQEFAPEACGYNSTTIKYVCKDGQADVLNEDLISIRQKLITYVGQGYTDKEIGRLFFKLFQCRKSVKDGYLKCGARLPKKLETDKNVEYLGEKNNLHLYTKK